MDEGNGKPRRGGSDLILRTLSSLVILPPVALLFWLGGAYFLGMLAVLAVLIVWEWAKLVAPDCAVSLRRLAGLFGGLMVLAAAIAFDKPAGVLLLIFLPLSFLLAA